METIDEKLVSLLLDKEAQICELTDYVSKLLQQLQSTQKECEKLQRLYSLSKKKAVKVIRKRIGYK